jgi:uncharacterized membrane protein YfbV (UPF0208 family)
MMPELLSNHGAIITAIFNIYFIVQGIIWLDVHNYLSKFNLEC